MSANYLLSLQFQIHGTAGSEALKAVLVYRAAGVQMHWTVVANVMKVVLGCMAAVKLF